MFSQSKGAGYVVAGDGVADAIDFDGTNDYLSRSSDLVGNTDGKTFTFSAWVWAAGTVTQTIYASSTKFVIETNGKTISCRGYTAGGAEILNFSTNSSSGGANETFSHILISVDLTSTANRHVYVNDIAVPVSWTTYSNSIIDFSDAGHTIAAAIGGAAKLKGRVADIFFDKTYRDLSVEANRRLFITADRKPAANQAALNPILYLPLNDPTQAGKNLGTGGDFALTGVVARSGRGPNQFNAAYSDLDGSADYLSRTSIVGIVDSKQVACSINFCLDSVDATYGEYIAFFGQDTSTRTFSIHTDTTGAIRCTCEGVVIFNSASNVVKLGRNYTFTISFDSSNAAKRHVYINGLPVSGSWDAYVNSNLDLTVANYWFGRVANSYCDGRLGNVFFDTKYIDLSVPENLAKFVTGTGIDAKPVDLGANGELPFGTPPLIYLPMYGNNAGKNYGTGGDFTVNSGPFTGARGPNEFWRNKAVFNGSTGYLERSPQLTGVVNSNKLSLVCTINKSVTTTGHYLIGSNNGSILVFVNGSNQLVILAKNNSSITILTATVTSPLISDNTIFSIMIFCDLSDTIKRGIYINGTPAATVNWSTYTNDTIALSQSTVLQVGANGAGAEKLDGSLSEFYFTTEYIDFSQEANRLKFRDAFGNPVDLSPQIQAGTLPNPAIYMRFDPANFGKNLGMGGDFTVNGTITDGGQL